MRRVIPVIERPELILVTGLMFSNKTTTLVRMSQPFLMEEKYRKQVVFFRPYSDTRQGDQELILTHGGWSFSKDVLKATIVRDATELYRIAQKFQFIQGDEGQLFEDPALPEVFEALFKQGKKVHVVALDFDWRGNRYEVTEKLIRLVTEKLKNLPGVELIQLRGICYYCGDYSTRSQLLDDKGNPVSIKADLPQRIIGDNYRKTCDWCWKETTPGAEEVQIGSFEQKREVDERAITHLFEEAEGMDPYFHPVPPRRNHEERRR
jgi:thymidine kinase